MAKNNWYRDKPEASDSTQADEEPKPRGWKRKSDKISKSITDASNKKGGKRMETSTIISLPNTKAGILLNRFKERERIWSELTGFKVKYIEAGGTPLANMFDDESGRPHCGRDNCPPCDGSEEGKRQNCRTRGILYQTSCLICKNQKKASPLSSSPQGGRDQEKTFHQAGYEADPTSSDINHTGRIGVYIGESSRSLHERTQEHLNDARKLDSKSHIPL